MEKDKQAMFSALSDSVKELQKGIDTHCCLLAALMEEPIDVKRLQIRLEQCPERQRERQLREALQEAVEVIEETRRSFKSKRLEALRKKLTQVLIDLV